ncbi:SET domain-containing [Micractinium conductrix]|uniref:SET domain-containing n=1 Tax=Micractinium conductrix TaxID=554055 RepID=A0A2P6VGT2_9CHLO|nr:SET domain-containing [Micractinium conductrix]|eukprot:PSC73293.1 SET domain-containing [Micractinium conductrix]
MVTTAASPQKKKKGKKFVPLPTLEAAAGQLAWRLGFSAKLGRHAVADMDLPAGTLILTEKPVVAIPRSKLAGHVCHACFRPLASPVESKAGFNPCLPRYCAPCKGGSPDLLALDSKLAGLRIKLNDIAKEHPVEHELLHLLVLLDVRRSTAASAKPAQPATPSLADETPVLRCSVADADAVASPWERKAEAWRKAVTAALRPLHKELVALEESGALEGYRASRLEQLQSDAAMLICNLTGVGAEGASQEAGVGLFPAGAALNHSCRPNCISVPIGQTMYVRTIVDVPAGAQLTVCHVQAYDPRPVRQAALLQERGLKCACERCSEPLAKSTDRFLEGVWCMNCTTDVLLALPPGTPEAQAAAAQYEEELAAAEAEEEAAARKKGGKKQQQEGAAANGGGAAAAAAPELAGPEGGKAAAEGEGKEEEGEAAKVDKWWRCAGCGHVELAHNTAANGPGDVVGQADKMWQQGAMLYQMKVPQLMPQAEAFLQSLQQGMDGRLHPYHTRVIDSLAPLINLALRRGDALSVFNYSVALWEAENAVQARYSLHQLQYLSAIVDTSAAKATHAQSAVVKRQFEKKLKAAMTTAAEIRRVLLGKSS